MSCFLLKRSSNLSTLVFVLKILFSFLLLHLWGGEMLANPNSNGNEKQQSITRSKLSKPSERKSDSKVQRPNPSIMKLKNQNGKWRPLDLVWEESSGAVAPEYRYAKKYHLYTQENKIFLFRYILKKGIKILEETKEIDPINYEKWISNLLKKNIHLLPYEGMPEEPMTGVSYNFVSFRLGSAKSKYYYRLDDINQEGWEQKKAIINLIERMKP